jgi:hypothetical protein
MRRLFSPAVLAATAIYFALTTVLTWPLILHPGSVVPNDPGDPLLNTFIMAWNARVVPLTAGWWNGPQFFPVHGATAFSEHLLGLSLITTPVILATHNPLLAYNLAFFASFVLCALSAYGLTYSVARSHQAALVAGLAFGFAPYRMSQLAHVQVLSAYWMPLALLGLHRYFEAPRTRWLVLFAGAWLMQALTCGYYLFYLSVLIALWLFWFAAGREPWTRIARVVVAWGIAAALMTPVLYGYWTFQRGYGMRRWPNEIAQFSADIASVLKAPGGLRFWAWLNVVDHAESSLFPGLTPVVLVLAGLVLRWRAAAREHAGHLRISRVLVMVSLVFLTVVASYFYLGAWKVEIGGVRLLSVGTPHKPLSVALLLLATAGLLHPSIRTAWRRRSAMAFYALAAVVMWLFSLGPAPTLMNRPFIYKAPYAWLMALPGADGIRVPARFWMLAALCLAVAAGLALRQLGIRWPRLARALPALACVGLLTDAWPRSTVPMIPPPLARPIQTRAVARLELPVDPPHDAVVLYRAIEHRRPVINGYSGYFAPHYWALQYLLEQRDPAVLTRLSGLGALEVVVDRDLDADGRWARFVGGHPQAELVHHDDQYSTYRIQRGPRVAPLEHIGGEVLPIASIAAADNAGLVGSMTDGDILTRWHAGREQRPGDSVTVDLGAEHDVIGVEMLIGGYVADFPRRLTIATSADGVAWSDVWTGGTAMMAFGAALEDPLNVTLPFGFELRHARYLRFTQIGLEQIYYWSIAELRIRGR